MPRCSGGTAVADDEITCPSTLDGSVAVGDEAGDHAQRGRLAAARRPQQRHQLALAQADRFRSSTTAVNAAVGCDDFDVSNTSWLKRPCLRLSRGAA
jgi:hypothetical protein